MKKMKVVLMTLVLAFGITGAFAFKSTSNFACSGPLFYFDPITGYQPVNTVWDCNISNPITCVYYEDEQGNKQPCDEPLGEYTVIVP